MSITNVKLRKRPFRWYIALYCRTNKQVTIAVFSKVKIIRFCKSQIIFNDQRKQTKFEIAIIVNLTSYP